MAVTYGFYDSLNHDRLYNAQQMSAIFDGIINDGVFMSVGNQFHTVAGTGMQVIVKSGRAWFDSTWTLNDAEYPLSIDAADVLLTRIDAVVLEVNSEVATRANTIKVVKGTPASTPAKPTLTNTATIHQHALAYVTVAKNTTAITNSMIEIVVGKTETPYVTAILQTTDITDLFKKWESDFQIWFETVKGTLDGDVALNLQNQIDHCVKKADKATSADIEAGTADKWVDAKTAIKIAYPIGHITQTISKTMDDTWQLCNGEPITVNDQTVECVKKILENNTLSSGLATTKRQSFFRNSTYLMKTDTHYVGLSYTDSKITLEYSTNLYNTNTINPPYPTHEGNWKVTISACNGMAYDGNDMCALFIISLSGSYNSYIARGVLYWDTTFNDFHWCLSDSTTSLDGVNQYGICLRDKNLYYGYTKNGDSYSWYNVYKWTLSDNSQTNVLQNVQQNRYGGSTWLSYNRDTKDIYVLCAIQASSMKPSYWLDKISQNDSITIILNEVSMDYRIYRYYGMIFTSSNPNPTILAYCERWNNTSADSGMDYIYPSGNEYSFGSDSTMHSCSIISVDRTNHTKAYGINTNNIYIFNFTSSTQTTTKFIATSPNAIVYEDAKTYPKIIYDSLYDIDYIINSEASTISLAVPNINSSDYFNYLKIK